MKSFNRSKPSDIYGFTTTREDFYTDRILQEATDSTNFIVVHEFNAESQEDSVILCVRKSILNIADNFPDLTLGPTYLTNYLESALETPPGAPWLIAQFGTENYSKALNILRQDIRRINNALEGRTIRVSVESF